MPNGALPSERVSFDRLAWICVCVALAVAPHAVSLPPWITSAVALCAVLRIAIAARGGNTPPKSLRVVIALCAIGILFLQFRTFNGLNAGTALLTLVAGLKLLETQTQRDIHIITYLIYFLSLATLLKGDSFALLGYLIAVCLLTTSTLLRTSSARAGRSQRESLRYATRIIAQALPLALLLWLFFPRFSGPLWQLPADSGAATTGLSDTMSPGDIGELALSDEIAFRVHFFGSTPPSGERYWRGPVLHDFDGRQWSRGEVRTTRPGALRHTGPAYQYRTTLEPSIHGWIFALDWPSQWDLPSGFLTPDYTLMQADGVARALDVAATSYTHGDTEAPLSDSARGRDLALPDDRNPRTRKLALQLRAQYPDDADLIDAVLNKFRHEQYFYTLNPPQLGNDSVDEFLFDSKRGFCGHYASAFAMLMRAARIPTRVVTGYQGGNYNRFADYWLIRQRDAHAWDEVWIENHGWRRIDPTAAVAPERIERGAIDALTAGAPLINRWDSHTLWFRDLRMRVDALRQLWRTRVLQYNQGSQEHMLSLLHVPAPSMRKLILILAGGLSLCFLWLTWQVRHELAPSTADPLARAFARLCRKMARAGIPRASNEGAENYAARIALLRPDLALTIATLCRHYSALRYEALPSATDVAVFRDAVRRFKPRRQPQTAS